MNATQANKATTVIDEAAVSKAILAIESADLTPKEQEDELLTRLVAPISLALRRGDSREQIRGRLKANGIHLHYRRLEKLFEMAASLSADPVAQLYGGVE
jgi:hypothetical protein